LSEKPIQNSLEEPTGPFVMRIVIEIVCCVTDLSTSTLKSLLALKLPSIENFDVDKNGYICQNVTSSAIFADLHSQF
jgi:hypothetical protein